MQLFGEIQKYKQKLYTNALLKGTLIAGGIVLAAVLFFSTLEYFGRFDSTVRAVFFYSFLALLVGAVSWYVFTPLSYLLKLRQPISDEEAAQRIGRHFPTVRDKLLNTLQLHKGAAQLPSNMLLQASLQQRTVELSPIRFTEAVDYNENRKYLRYLLPLLLLFLGIWVIQREFFTESARRIIQYEREFATPAPFQFVLQNKKLEAYKNEDFTVSLKLEGYALPPEVYLMSSGNRYKMQAEGGGQYRYTFSKLQKNTAFYFTAEGFNSDQYDIALRLRPTLLSFKASLNYPAYLGKPAEEWSNIGNLVVPEGTQIKWEFKTAEAESLSLQFGQAQPEKIQKVSNRSFVYQKTAKIAESYQIKLQNQHSSNKEEISYQITVIPDQHPKINMQSFEDKAIFQYLSIGGSASDDYGLSALQIGFRIVRKGRAGAYQTVKLPVSPNQTIQNYYYQIDLMPLQLAPGDKIEYYAQVWDNDGVNGAKSARTGVAVFQLPDEQALREEINTAASQTSSQIQKTIEKTRKVQQDINKLQQKLLQKQSLDFQDKKMLEDLLKQREELMEELRQIQEKNQLTNQKQERFSEQSDELREKMEQLNKLMDELMDEETRKLYEELQKLLEQNRQNDAILQQLDKLQNSEQSLEKELERALELFKQLQVEQKLEQTTKDLKQLAEEQKALSEKTEQKQADPQTLEKEQEALNERFEQIQEELNKLEELNNSLEDPNDLKDFSEQEEQIKQEQQKSLDQLQKNQQKKAGESQKNAGQKMQEMAEEMEQMQADMQQEQMQENMDDLRALLENIVKLSFDQESLMQDFRLVSMSDPRFKDLTQRQLKMKDDVKMVEDSLQSLAKRVFQIESFVTKEVEALKNHLNESLYFLRERNVGMAVGKQQFAMTSLNNLALLLNDILQQMQSQAQQMQQNAGGKPNKQQKSGKPNISQLQQQLNQQIQQLKESGKSGRELSEELAKLAAEQERLRRALQEAAKKMGKNEGGKELEQLQKLMEETEKDLVNKRLSDETLMRQKNIETRLLESEKAMREQDEEEERKAETSKNKNKRTPPNLDQYLKQKEKQVELLKTVPPALSPYYKKEIDLYFEKIDQ
ncbi:DUF4175 family protein [Eisenibacter elegans]|uniref:DUF4175 family protein n=1 Tax=Eisenibacter elegans TaxID=997 RepID=UPI00040E8E31|nr:DUF4175 family protein [Eisenibacter elegans]